MSTESPSTKNSLPNPESGNGFLSEKMRNVLTLLLTVITFGGFAYLYNELNQILDRLSKQEITPNDIGDIVQDTLTAVTESTQKAATATATSTTTTTPTPSPTVSPSQTETTTPSLQTLFDILAYNLNAAKDEVPTLDNSGISMVNEFARWWSELEIAYKDLPEKTAKQIPLFPLLYRSTNEEPVIPGFVNFGFRDADVNQITASMESGNSLIHKDNFDNPVLDISQGNELTTFPLGDQVEGAINTAENLTAAQLKLISFFVQVISRAEENVADGEKLVLADKVALANEVVNTIFADWVENPTGKNEEIDVYFEGTLLTNVTIIDQEAPDLRSCPHFLEQSDSDERADQQLTQQTFDIVQGNGSEVQFGELPFNSRKVLVFKIDFRQLADWATLDTKGKKAALLAAFQGVLVEIFTPHNINTANLGYEDQLVSTDPEKKLESTGVIYDTCGPITTAPQLVTPIASFTPTVVWLAPSSTPHYVQPSATATEARPTKTEAPPPPTATQAPTEVPTATKAPTEVPTATKAPTEVPTATQAPTEVPTATEVPRPTATEDKSPSGITSSPVPTAITGQQPTTEPTSSAGGQPTTEPDQPATEPEQKPEVAPTSASGHA